MVHGKARRRERKSEEAECSMARFNLKNELSQIISRQAKMVTGSTLTFSISVSVSQSLSYKRTSPLRRICIFALFESLSLIQIASTCAELSLKLNAAVQDDSENHTAESSTALDTLKRAHASMISDLHKVPQLPPQDPLPPTTTRTNTYTCIHTNITMLPNTS